MDSEYPRPQPDHTVPDSETGQTEVARRRKIIERRLPEQLGQFFDTEESRSDGIIERIQRFLPLYTGDQAALLASIRAASIVTDRKDFIRKMTLALEPVLEVYAENGEDLEAAPRQEFLEKGRFVEINQLLAYDIYGTTLRLHVPPNEMTSLGDKRQLLFEGLRNLAATIAEQEDIERINVASWIVVTHPHLLERLGFTIDGGIDDTERLAHFPGETRPIAMAHIDRDEFLRRYGSKYPN